MSEHSSEDFGTAIKAMEGFAERATETINATRESVDEVKERLKDLEQRAAPGFAGGGRPGAPVETFGKRVLESEGFKTLAAGESKGFKTTIRGSLFTKNTITGDAGSPPAATDTLAHTTRMPGIVGGAFRMLRIRDLLPILPTSSNMVEFTKEVAFTNNAAAQASEGAAKAETDITFTLTQAAVATIAHFIKVSRQALADSPALQQFLDIRMRYGVLLEEEDQLLNGDGSSGALSGFLDSGNFTTFNGTSGDTYLDQLRKAIESLQTADYMPTGIVLNPQDWGTIERTKDDQSRYLFANPQSAAQPMLWGLPVVPTNSIAQGTFLMADFQNAAILWDREQVTVEMSESDDTNFTKNLVTIRAEERLALTVIRPAAVLSGSFI